jgi:hypothetical protein
MMPWLDRFCLYGTFGTKITKNIVTVRKIYGFKVVGTRLQIYRARY